MPIEPRTLLDLRRPLWRMSDRVGCVGGVSQARGDVVVGGCWGRNLCSLLTQGWSLLVTQHSYFRPCSLRLRGRPRPGVACRSPRAVELWGL